MALTTCHLVVLAGQSEFGLIMVEFARGFPPVKIMALDAIAGELSAMSIFVTGQAILSQSEESTFQIDSCIQLPGIGYNSLRLVTITALRVFVLSQQREAGEPVVEVFLAIWPVNHIEGPSVMIAVTLETRLLLAGNDEEMIACPLRQPLADFRVAGKALFYRRAATQIVAFGTIPDPLEIYMRF